MRGAPYEKEPDVHAKVDLGAKVDLTDTRGDSALMIAARSANLAAMKVLVAAKAKVDLRNKTGETALILTIANQTSNDKDDTTTEAVKLLLKAGADVNQPGPEGCSALLVALVSWNVKAATIEALLDAGPDVRIRNKDGQDALFLAVSNKERNIHIARLLELGADLKTTDKDGVDLLMLAAAHEAPRQVRDFIDRGLSPVRKTARGTTAVHFALRAGPPRNDPDEGFGRTILDQALMVSGVG